jgi:hypothetical protein
MRSAPNSTSRAATCAGPTRAAAAIAAVALAPAISRRRGRCAAMAPVTNQVAANTKARVAIALRGAGELPSRGLHHIAAVVDLRDDAIGLVLAVQRDSGAGPFGRRISGGLISKHITVPVSVLAGDDDAGLVGRPRSLIPMASRARARTR